MTSEAGNGIRALRSDFQFDDRTAGSFDEHVRNNVPFYDEVQDLIASLSDWYLGRDSLVVDLGCATAETSARIAARHGTLQDLHFGLVDESRDMLSIAKRKMADVAIGIGYDVHCDTIVNPLPKKFRNASFAVMAFTLQFVPIRYRMTVLRNVKRSLRPGGALCLVEKVEGGVAEFERAFTRILDERKMLAGMSADEVIGKEQAIRGRLVPLSLNENVRMLRAAGFQEIEIFWRWLSFCGIIATWGRQPSRLKR
jgi:tRNA (cmo5U34)-methyltransferase